MKGLFPTGTYLCGGTSNAFDHLKAIDGVTRVWAIGDGSIVDPDTPMIVVEGDISKRNLNIVQALMNRPTQITTHCAEHRDKVAWSTWNDEELKYAYIGGMGATRRSFKDEPVFLKMELTKTGELCPELPLHKDIVEWRDIHEIPQGLELMCNNGTWRSLLGIDTNRMLSLFNVEENQ